MCLNPSQLRIPLQDGHLTVAPFIIPSRTFDSSRNGGGSSRSRGNWSTGVLWSFALARMLGICPSPFVFSPSAYLILFSALATYRELESSVSKCGASSYHKPQFLLPWDFLNWCVHSLFSYCYINFACGFLIASTIGDQNSLLTSSSWMGLPTLTPSSWYSI